MVNKSVLLKKAYSYALKFIECYKMLQDKKEYILSKQMIRSGTSIGANITEANGAISVADFSSKISIAYKEGLETKYWLNLLMDAGYLNKEHFIPLHKDCDELCKIMYSILKTTRIKNSEQSTVNSDQ